jgi:hypothetical protein
MSQGDKKRSHEEWNTTLTKMNQRLNQASTSWKWRTKSIKACSRDKNKRKKNVKLWGKIATTMEFKKFKENIKITNEEELGQLRIKKPFQSF